ncbi:hypothetical protein PR048_004181 [Dryococelus australis]|uniref:Myb/SANT-like DNA-binding domain-containing protein n=1 Tax=Dryococelus australis TaxID=614101 RepID=A0ABQ9I6P3_9NEOP|nr:hypothetical protein PR048_004181 [Dryococelus australis]
MSGPDAGLGWRDFMHQKSGKWVSSLSGFLLLGQGPIKTGCSSDVTPKFVWPHEGVLLLLEEYRKLEHEFYSKRKRHGTLWEEIATAVRNQSELNVTGIQCQQKISSLKRTYANIKENVSNYEAHEWPYFSGADIIPWWQEGHGGVVVRLLASRLGKLGLFSGWVTPKYLHVGIMLLVSRFSRGSPVFPTSAFRCCSILTSLHPNCLSIPRCYELSKSVQSTPLGGKKKVVHVHRWRNMVLTADTGKARWSVEQCWNARARKLEIPKKTSSPVALFGMIPTCKNLGATLPGIKSSSLSWEASSLITTSPLSVLAKAPTLISSCIGMYRMYLN